MRISAIIRSLSSSFSSPITVALFQWWGFVVEPLRHMLCVGVPVFSTEMFRPSFVAMTSPPKLGHSVYPAPEREPLLMSSKCKRNKLLSSLRTFNPRLISLQVDSCHEALRKHSHSRRRATKVSLISSGSHLLLVWTNTSMFLWLQMVLMLSCHCIGRLTRRSHLFFLSSALDLAEYVRQLALGL